LIEAVVRGRENGGERNRNGGRKKARWEMKEERDGERKKERKMRERGREKSIITNNDWYTKHTRCAQKEVCLWWELK
jgi:hypothetical protein